VSERDPWGETRGRAAVARVGTTPQHWKGRLLAPPRLHALLSEWAAREPCPFSKYSPVRGAQIIFSL